MAGEREPRLAADPATRRAILITLSFLLCGGAFRAWEALQPPPAPLPAAGLARIAAAAGASAPHPQVPDTLCSPSIDLLVGHFASAGATTTQGLAPAVAAAAAAQGPILPPLRVDYASLYVDATALVLKAKQCPPGTADCAATALGTAAAHRLGWRLHSELATAVGDRQTILVLEGVKGTAPMKARLSPQVALLVTADGSSSAAALAAEVVGWLADGVPRGMDEAATAHSVRDACLQKAAAAVAAARAELALGASTGVIVTPRLAQAAGTAVEAYDVAVESSGSWQEGLARARAAVVAAVALGTHPDLATPPQLPPEHALTMLLPISLPLCLAVVQALGREAKAAKARRRRKRVGTDAHTKTD